MACARSPMSMICALLAMLLMAASIATGAAEECTGDACAAGDDVVLLQNSLSKNIGRRAMPLSREAESSATAAPQKRPPAAAEKVSSSPAVAAREEVDTLGLLQSTFLKQVHAASKAQLATGARQKPRAKASERRAERKTSRRKA
eukprot:CAMPEP_0115682806 /NCGR_PEP_ID=MMETSP0272-20121206/58050_1 /TAXON_ID=71861 /ORGANISM="Scrippsiella trochoidea, Strain CCMP3099" /LENGTH=144 /DNA_ID=CAMNT_0003122205 /DNA_START=70 /DNA_END=504 /DNA_ORIENTATION=-